MKQDESFVSVALRFLGVIFIITFLFEPRTFHVLMSSRQDIIPYLNVIISWPAAAIFLGMIFRKEISGFISRMVKGPLGTEALPEAQEPATKESKEVTIEDSIPVPLQNAGQGGASLTREQVDTLVRRFTEVENLAKINEYKYLTQFFVPDTRRAIKWFEQKGEAGATIESFNDSFTVSPTNIGPEAQKAAVIKALLDTSVLDRENEILKLSSKGSNYLNYLKENNYL